MIDQSENGVDREREAWNEMTGTIKGGMMAGGNEDAVEIERSLIAHDFCYIIEYYVIFCVSDFLT